MRAPSGENAALCTACSCPRRAAISAPVAASQMRAVRSEEAVTMRAPSGENAALSTRPSCPRRAAISRRWRRPRSGPCVAEAVTMRAVGRERGACTNLCPRRRRSRPVAASQSGRAVAEAVTMRAPSGENAALSTHSWCPRRAAISAPVAASQRRAVRSSEAVTMRAPSGENAALSHPPLVPAQGGDLGAGGGVPDAGRAVAGGGDDAGAVGRERGASHPAPRARAGRRSRRRWRRPRCGRCGRRRR